MNFNRDVVQSVQEEVTRLENEYKGNAPLNIIMANMQEKGISSLDTGIALDVLEKKNIITEINNGYFRLTKNIKEGEKMNQKQIQTQANSSRTQALNCTEEQKEFARLVKDNKGDIFDANKILIHRGAQVTFAGCGDKALKYRMAIGGFSDKEPVEYKDFWLDWDDSALYDEGGLADQIREIVGPQKVQPVLKPAIQAQVGGK